MKKRTYWRDNLRLVAICLAIWFTVSFGFGILLVDVLNGVRVGGVGLGFWFAQQGSIYAFVALIFFYAWRMSIVDDRHEVDDRHDAGARPGAGPMPERDGD